MNRMIVIGVCLFLAGMMIGVSYMCLVQAKRDLEWQNVKKKYSKEYNGLLKAYKELEKDYEYKTALEEQWDKER